MLRDYNENGYVIRISEPALIYLCQAGLEAYAVKHLRAGRGRKSALETYGLLWGHETRLLDGRTFFSIQMATVDTSAEMRTSWVLPTDEALELKRDLMTSYWPHLDFLGDFHTHPYESHADVNPDRLYCFSDTDRQSLEENPDHAIRHDYRVGLVLTIAQMRRASSRTDRWLPDGALEFTLGNYRLWLKAYVLCRHEGAVEFTADDDPKVLLDCPALVGLQGEYTPFGRGQGGRSKKHRSGMILARPTEQERQ